ncbi:parallel beta-helix domain-containing protein [Saccharospirillum sp. HFRX-1]|uniref:parallel beta-helix domain-containing protein n=1 Tax=unclassified Saccharospirillum TaxID=2633430 RepID=UPI003715D343
MLCLRLVRLAVLMLVTTLLMGCQGDEAARPTLLLQQQLTQQLADAQPGDQIDLPAGRFPFDQAIQLTTEGLILAGSEEGKTVLSFANQATDDASVQLLANGIRLRNFSIEDSHGVAVSIKGVQRAQLIGLRVQWQDKDLAASTAIEVTDSRRILLDEVAVRSATQAGILLHNSAAVVVRNARVSDSLIGIDVRNSQHSDLYGNMLVDNTQGVRIVNALNSSMSGYAIRLFDNDIQRNNKANTAPETSELAGLWQGVGVQIEGGDAIEVFDNRLTNNGTADIYVRSVSADEVTRQQSALDPYPESIYVHDNQYGDSGTQPDGFKLKWLRWTLFGFGGRLPPVLWDGQLDVTKQVNGQTPIHLRLCVPEDESPVLNLDQANGFADPQIEPQWHQCRLPSLPAVSNYW